MNRKFALLSCIAAGFAAAVGSGASVAADYAQAQSVLQSFNTKGCSSAMDPTVGYLNLKGVKGSATEAAFKDQIPVLLAQQFIANPGRGPGAAPDYYLVIPIDQASPLLQQAASTGMPFPDATMSYVENSRGQRKVSSQDSLQSVRVALYMQGAGSSQFPRVAVIGLSFAKACWAYGSTKTCFDYEKNTRY